MAGAGPAARCGIGMIHFSADRAVRCHRGKAGIYAPEAPKMPDANSHSSDPEGQEHQVTDMRIIAWSLVVTAFGTLWIAFQLTLIASTL